MENTLITVLEWLDAHSAIILSFLLGVLVTAGIWLTKHPEDFYTIEEEEDEENEKPVRADK